MKAYNAIMHVVYAVAIVGAIAFVVAGVVPDNLEEIPLDIEIGAESEYPASDSEGILRDNIRGALDGVDETVHVAVRGKDGILAEITTSNREDSITDAISAIQSLDEDDIVYLKRPSGKVLTQPLIFKESDNISMSVYTEVTIHNKLRYDLKDIDVGIDLLSYPDDESDRAVKYRILESAPTTIKTGKSATLPISVKINMMNALLTVMSGGGDSLEIMLGIDISGKYYYGLAGASVYAVVGMDISDGEELPSFKITKNITPKKIEIKIDEKLDDFPMDFEIPDEVTITIGDVEVKFTNDEIDGLSIVVETDGVKTIVEALKEKLRSGDLNIEIESGGELIEFEIDEENFEQLIEIVESIMEAFA